MALGRCMGFGVSVHDLKVIVSVISHACPTRQQGATRHDTMPVQHKSRDVDQDENRSRATPARGSPRRRLDVHFFQTRWYRLKGSRHK